MTTIFIAVEVPDSELAEFLVTHQSAQLTNAVLGVPPTFEQAAPSAPVQPAQPDPWQNQAQPPQVPQAPVQTPVQPTAQPPVQSPMCGHGPMRYVPAGFSQKTGRSYAAFWGCSAPQGAAKCKSVAA
jgi:hypothetical protein